jgi:hypothetical protein
MKNVGWFSRLSRQAQGPAMIQRIAGVAGIAILMTMGVAAAQTAAPGAPGATPVPITVVPDGYSIHQTIDMGGHMVGLSGSGAMYNSMINVHSGPRMLNQTVQMHALPGKKNGLFDSLSAISSGYGGDPINFTKLNASKGKIWDFSGMFRRSRQYFDYDLLGNPNITTGLSTPIGPSNAPVGKLAWPQVQHSAVMFNTVRRMTDAELTFMPLARITYRVGYNHSTMEGPSLSPSYTIFKYDALLQEYQRNGSDDYMGAIDFKLNPKTKLTFQEDIYRYKADSFFTLDPNGFMVQEADGTPAYLGNWDSQTPYGISACNTGSMGTAYTSSSVYQILTPNPSGGMPIINAACAVVTKYLRTLNTRTTLPTSMVRLQSNSFENFTINGDARYTLGTSKLPSYYEQASGLNGAVRSTTWSGGYARVHREMLSADLGFVWQVTKSFSLADQVNYSSTKQPGLSLVPVPVNLSTPAAPNQTINYNGPLTASAGTLPHGVDGVLSPGFYGQGIIANNLTAAWDLSARTRFAVTYRYSTRSIGQGVPHKGEVVETDPVSGEITIHESTGIANLAFRPTSNWDVNGTVEIGYYDDVLTPIAPRQLKQYRMHTMYRPKPWATINGAFTDRERHNNTFNNAADISSSKPYEGPINHVDYSRIGSIGASLTPNEHYGIDLNYAYSRVYTATNVCYNSGGTATLPGAATLTASGAPAVCPGIFARGSTTQLASWFGRDFQDAPTQSASVALMLSPNAKVHTNLGYRMSNVDGSRFFNDARDVNGSMNSKYQSPFASFAWAQRQGLVWKAEYNYFGYGEGGPSGAQLCSTTTATNSVVSPCTSFSQPTGLTEPTSGLTAPRVFHANNVTLGVHYEF